MTQLSPESTPTRRLRVRHSNHYSYSRPIVRSSHRLHLRPVHDRRQTLVEHSLIVNPNVTAVDYEDVFGNWTTRFEISQPYRELTLKADSVVDLLDVDPFAFGALPNRPAFPVNWMPWELKMLTPYLTPIELPETQLTELYDYAMSFATRNNYDLLETLFDLNLSIFREFDYVPASTSLETTPYEVLVNKKGVCQDFANLMICVARLLNIPARYVCGYVYTGNTGTSRAGSDASHAWVQLYIPTVGWKAFDPTNGVLPATDHIRISVGRHYRDTAPIAGTLFSPAGETLSIDVEVSPAD